MLAGISERNGSSLGTVNYRPEKKDDLESYGLRMEAKQGRRFRVRPIERCSRGCWWTSITIDPRYMVGLGLKVSGSPNFEY